MPSCTNCNRLLVPMEGIQLGEELFCGARCMSSGSVILRANSLPSDVIQGMVQQAHSGPCPVCRLQRGAVDVHYAHKIASFFIFSTWSSAPQISCTHCAIKRQSLALVYCILVGWWGFPWGILGTPVQVVRNIISMVKSGKKPIQPSAQLERFVRIAAALQLPLKVAQELYPKSI